MNLGISLQYLQEAVHTTGNKGVYVVCMHTETELKPGEYPAPFAREEYKFRRNFWKGLCRGIKIRTEKNVVVGETVTAMLQLTLTKAHARVLPFDPSI